MPEVGKCLICDAHLERPAVGRPPTYCSATCKAAARYERDRLQSRLSKWETWLAEAPSYGTPKQELRRIQERIDAAQARFLVLLGGEVPGGS